MWPCRSSLNTRCKSGPDPWISATRGLRRPISIVFECGAVPGIGGSWFFVVMGGICLWPRVSHAGFATRGRGASRHCRRRGLAAGERGAIRVAKRRTAQSRRKFVLAKSRRQRRPLRTSLAAARIRWRISVRNPCVRAAIGSSSYCTARSSNRAVCPQA